MPETADAGLIARREARAEAGTVANQPPAGPFGSHPVTDGRSTDGPGADGRLAEGPGAAPGPRARRRRYRGWYRLLSPVAVVAGWQLLSSAGLITDGLVRLLERRALAWRRGILG
jgi:hypothetical protein